jgi:hypothetical protein
MAKSGDVARYTGGLPGSVQPGDKRAEVEQKIGSKPITSQIIPGVTGDQRWDRYNIGALEATFMFDEPNDQLSSASLRLPGGL